MPSNSLILCYPLLLLPSIFPSIRVFSSELAFWIRWPKYWSFSFSISPSSEYLGLISLRMDWFDFLAVQGTVKSLLQHHGLKASVLWCSAFFLIQLSYLCMTTGNPIALTIQTFAQSSSQGENASLTVPFPGPWKCWQMTPSARPHRRQCWVGKQGHASRAESSPLLPCAGAPRCSHPSSGFWTRCGTEKESLGSCFCRVRCLHHLTSLRRNLLS